MADNDLHYFTADGKETTEGATDSVVQYTEADATRRGLTFKATDTKPAQAVSRDELMKAAAFDGSEPKTESETETKGDSARPKKK